MIPVSLHLLLEAVQTCSENWMMGREGGLWGKQTLHADWLKYSCVLDDLMSLQKVTEDSATLLAYSLYIAFDSVSLRNGIVQRNRSKYISYKMSFCFIN